MASGSTRNIHLNTSHHLMKKIIPITAIFLVITLGNYVTFIHDGSVRTVEFISILAIGVLAGVLLTQLMQGAKTKGN